MVSTAQQAASLVTSCGLIRIGTFWLARGYECRAVAKTLSGKFSTQGIGGGSFGAVADVRNPPQYRKQDHETEGFLSDRLYATATIAGEYLATLKDYPPSQTPGSFNLDAAKKKIEEMSMMEN